MNEKLVENLLNYMNETKDFVLNQSPELIGEIISYHKAINFSCIGIFLPIFLICLGIFYYYLKYPKLEKYGITCETYVSLLVSSFFCLLTFIFLLESFRDLIGIYFSPKYFIIKMVLKMKG